MFQYSFRELNRTIYLYRLNSYRVLNIIFILICISFICIQYLCVKLFDSKEIPISDLTRLYHDMPLTINLHSYPVCHPKELYIQNLTSQYHSMYPNEKQQICFIIEHLGGGPWWSYVSHEFAEILTHLKELGIRSNVTYRPFSDDLEFNYKTNLTKYFLHVCNISENLPKEKQNPIIVLLWDINRFLWNQMRYQLNYLLEATQIRILVFIDDLHFASKGIFSGRQYLFQYVAKEIFSTYPYTFHNYYHSISPKKITWLPHSASILSHHSINETAENLLFVSGANLRYWYPCRWHAFSLCQTRKDLVGCLEHPGYGETMKNDSSFYYGGDRYFSYMRKYVFGLGTCQTVHYAIAKLFEIAANGLVLVTTDDLTSILGDLGLYLDEHFLTIDCSLRKRLMEEINRIQNIPKETLFKIRKKSQDVIFERHLTKHRAELLHTRLLSQALIASATSDEQRMQWEQWGRNCYRL